MKQRKYIVNIKKPCDQNYNLMNDNYAGKFCSVCSKSVIDFSEFSDREVDTILKRYNYQVCGKFRKEQLERPLDLSIRKSNFYPLLKVFLGLMLFGVTEKVVANNTKSDTFKSVFTNDFNNRLKEYQLSVANDTVNKHIEGVVIDSDGNPVSNVLVRAIELDFNSLTDLEGKFKILIPIDSQKLDVLRIGYFESDENGWHFRRYKIDEMNKEIRIIFYKTKPIKEILLGAIDVKKGSKWQFKRKKHS